MPQFQLDYGTQDAANQFKQLDAFTRGYIEAIFFTEANPDNEELADATLSDLAPEALVDIKQDCLDFQALAKRSLDLAYDYATVEYDEHQAGIDFWFTRNGHGVGFWDRGLGAVGEQLSKDAKSFGSQYVYRGDDGLIYIG